MRTFPLLSILLLAASLAGCSSGDRAPGGFTLHAGDWAEYRGSDGSTITARVDGLGVRADPWLNPVPVLLLTYSYKAAGPAWSPYTFEEAIDARGLVVQQVAHCANPELPENNAGTCQDSRLDVNFYGWGLPGGLGMGPTWFGHQGGDLAIPVRNPANATSTLGVKGVRDGDCQRIGFDGAEVGSNVIPITLVNGSRVSCPGTPFPNAFQSSGRWPRWFTQAEQVTYALQRFVPGIGPALAKPAPQEAWARSSLDFVEFGEPLYGDPAPDPFPFATWEAIDAAASAKPEVAQFLAEHPDAVPVTSVYSMLGSGYGGAIRGGRSEESERVVHVADGSGPCLRLVVKREVTVAGNLPTDRNGTTYEVKVSSCGEARLDLAGIARQQASYESAFAWGSRIIGIAEPEPIFVGYVQREVVTNWADAPRFHWYSEGYELNLAYKDPAPEQVGSMVKSYRYIFRVDGPSGAINEVNLPKDRAPLIGPV